MIERFLWEQADRQLEALQDKVEEALVIWDESVLQKSESLKLEGLVPVRPTKAARLKRIKPGYCNPPGGRPIFVPGWHRLSVLLKGMKETPNVVTMRWWTNRGERATTMRAVERDVLAAVSDRWGQMVVHVWDRGFAGTPWLEMAFVHAVRFVVRWPKRYQLSLAEGEPKPVWQLINFRGRFEFRSSPEQIWVLAISARRNTQSDLPPLVRGTADPTVTEVLSNEHLPEVALPLTYISARLLTVPKHRFRRGSAGRPLEREEGRPAPGPRLLASPIL